ACRSGCLFHHGHGFGCKARGKTRRQGARVMGRLMIFFAMALMLSAFSLVTARFQSRQLFVQVDRLEDKARELDTDWRRLQLERAELARNVRIDGSARQELHMISTSPDRTLYIKGVPGSAAASSQGGQP